MLATVMVDWIGASILSKGKCTTTRPIWRASRGATIPFPHPLACFWVRAVSTSVLLPMVSYDFAPGRSTVLGVVC